MGKFKPFQHDEMVAAGKAKPYSRSDYKTKEMQENSKGGGGDDGLFVIVPITVDYSGDNPSVSSEVPESTIGEYAEAGKYIVLLTDGGYFISMDSFEESNHAIYFAGFGVEPLGGLLYCTNIECNYTPDASFWDYQEAAFTLTPAET